MMDEKKLAIAKAYIDKHPGAFSREPKETHSIFNDYSEAEMKVLKEYQESKTPDIYKFARESKYSNLGEDLKGSARHKWHLCNSFDEANALGEGEKFATKAHLLKDIDWEKEIDEKGFKGYLKKLAFDSFPAKPNINPSYNTLDDNEFVAKCNATAGELKEESRQSYVKAINLLKDANMDNLYPLYSFLDREIDSLRKKDKFNALANQYCDINKKIRKNLFLASLLSNQSNEELKELLKPKSKEKKNTYDKIEEVQLEMKERIGREHEYNTFVEQSAFLIDKVGLKGVQWGQYITDNERREHTKNLTDSIIDLSDVLGVEPSKLSFGKELGISIGSRGKGQGQATYSTGDKIINITKEGYGTLSHEYFHAMDNLIAKKIKTPVFKKGRANNEGQWLTNGKGDLAPQIEKLDTAMQPFIDRMANDFKEKQVSSKDFDYYVNNRQELFARVGERFVQRKLEKAGKVNRYLSGMHTDNFVYPSDKELDEIEPHFEALIKEIQKKI